LLIAFFLVSNILTVNSAENNSKNNGLVVEVLNSEYIYSSSEIISLLIRTTGQNIGSEYEIEWILFDGYSQNGTFASNGTLNWQANTVVTQNTLEFSQFYTGGLKYTLIMMVFEDGAAKSELEIKFMVFRDSIQNPINDMLLFGDSISDQGNSFNAFGTPQSPPYYSGRFSNGPVWAEAVATEYGKSVVAGNWGESGTNRAFGGSQTGPGMSFFVIPNVGEQINRYLNNVNSNIDQDDLVFLFAGGNDFTVGAGNPNITLQNMIAHVNTLADSGAKEFVVVNIPPIEKTPIYSSNTPSDLLQTENNVIYYNTQLVVEMSSLASQRGLTIKVVDIHVMFNEIYYNGSFGGITNVVDEACGYTSGTCNSNDIAPNPDEFLFWDYVHPTRVIHEALSELILQEIGIPDTDGDLIGDADDLCEWTPTTELADSNGCSPSQLDDDNDGIKNGDDLCPNTPLDAEVDEFGCAESQKDTDGDGVTNDLDLCPNTLPNYAVDENGCASYQKDTDGDGVDDSIDICPDTGVGSIVDSAGCADYQRDTDDDSVTDDNDTCPDTFPDYLVDENGCADYQKDTDGDSITDDSDLCPDTQTPMIVNLDGCAQYQLDSDKDGITNDVDICPQTDSSFSVDQLGCADYEKDTDEDGITDDIDNCTQTEPDYEVDEIGCADYQRDTDGDGITDDMDICPTIIGTTDGCPFISITTKNPQDQTIFTKLDAVEYRFFISCESGCIMDVYAYPAYLGDIDLEPYMIQSESSNGTVEFTMEYGIYNVQALNLEILVKSEQAYTKIEHTVYFVDELPTDVVDTQEDLTEGGLSGVIESGKEAIADSDAVVILLNIALIFAIIFVLVLLIRSPKNDIIITSESDMINSMGFGLDDAHSPFSENIIEKGNTTVEGNEYQEISEENNLENSNELDIDWLDDLID